jgi:unsaturated chondroitin disaccharide hydrolase
VCAWDLVFTDPDTQRDSSAAAIAVCGLIELAKHLPDSDGDRQTYVDAAKAILGCLIAGYACNGTDPCDGLLRHGVYHMPNKVGIDECCIWGDYFYFEALMRLRSDWETFW